MKCRHILLMFIVAWLASGCTATKLIPEGKKLYVGADLEYVNPDMVHKATRTAGEIKANIRPQPNKKFIGLFRTRLWFYQRIKDPKMKVTNDGDTIPKRGFRNLLKNKVGEPPVYLNNSDVERSKLLIEKFLREKGYFGSSIRYEINDDEEKTISVTYYMTSKGRHRIRDIHFPDDSTNTINKIIYENADLLRAVEGRMYKLDLLNDDRNTIATLVRDSGYYAFSPDYIYFYVDTTVGDAKVDIYYNIESPDTHKTHKQFYFRNVYIFPGYSVDQPNEGLVGDTSQFRKFLFVYPPAKKKYIRVTAVGRNLLTIPGERFSQTRHNYSVNKMLDLGVFKFVNIRYEKVGEDSLDAYIYMTPGNSQSITAELNASTTTTNFLGTFASLSYVNRNIFRGAEEMSLTVSGGVETQVGKKNASFINTIELSGKWELSIPRFVVPWKFLNKATQYTPRTKFSLSDGFQSRYQFFSLNSFGANITYDWRRNSQQHHQFSPLFVQRVRTLNTTEEFDAILRENPVLRTNFEDVFILGFQHIYTFYNPDAKRPLKNYWYFNGDIQLAGNVFNAVGNALSKNKEGQVQITGVPIAQYFRIETDTRYFFVIHTKTQWVNRVIGGISVPYGNIDRTPYIKQFFSGGSTGMRAYRFRTLGPGSYDGSNTNTSYPDQTGDIKLEWSSEFRHTLYKFIKGAFFVDVGNIWLMKEDPQRPGAKFSKDFYKEFAIGGGYGLRLDFQFVVIRLDVAVPFRKPSLPDGDRWTFDKMEWRSKDWRKDNLMFNIAIGYPF